MTLLISELCIANTHEIGEKRPFLILEQKHLFQIIQRRQCFAKHRDIHIHLRKGKYMNEKDTIE